MYAVCDVGCMLYAGQKPAAALPFEGEVFEPAHLHHGCDDEAECKGDLDHGSFFGDRPPGEARRAPDQHEHRRAEELRDNGTPERSLLQQIIHSAKARLFSLRHPTGKQTSFLWKKIKSWTYLLSVKRLLLGSEVSRRKILK